jgi:hypothetical protein
MPIHMTTRINRGNAEDQDRWRTKLKIAEATENFPSGGSLILAESHAHALQIAKELRAQGKRSIVRGAYVRTTAELSEQP